MQLPSTVNRAIGLLAFVQFFVALEVSMLFPMGPILALALDFRVERLGYLNGAFLGSAFISGLLGALFLDRFNRRGALVLALLGLTVGTMLAGFAVDLKTLVACRIVSGLFGGPTAALSLAMVSDIVAVEKRGRALAVVARGGAVAIVAGVPMAMQVTEWGGWRWAFHAAAILGLGLAALMQFGLPKGIGAHAQAPRPAIDLLRDMAVILKRPATLVAIACTSILAASMTMIGANIAPFMVFNMHFPEGHLKFMWMAGGAFTLVGSQVAGPMIDRFGALTIFWITSLSVIVVLAFFFVLGPPYIPAVVAFCGYNLTHSSRMVAMNAAISMVPDPDERGRFMSMVTAGNQLLSACAVMATASLIHTAPTGELVNMNYVGLLAIAGAGAALLISRVLKREIVVAH